jgi:hypothetical protein
VEDTSKGKGHPATGLQAQGVPGRLRSGIFVTFGTTRVVGRQPYTSAAFTPGKISGTHFQGLSRPQGIRFRRGEPWKKSPVTPPGIDPTSSAVPKPLRYPRTPLTTTLPQAPGRYKYIQEKFAIEEACPLHSP